MLTLLRSVTCCCPQPAGEKDILIAGSKIYKIAPPGEIAGSPLFEKVVDCRGLTAFPGFIDQHVHILGAGGEQGFQSRLPELSAEEILSAGVTAVVGLLGADGVTRRMEALYAKAKALEAQGLSTYLYAGSYAVPPVTLTGSLLTDMTFIDKVVGAGEIAIADHRSTSPDACALVKIAAEVHLGGLLTEKAGVVHLHVGDGKDGLRVLREAVRESDLPLEMFVPTHTNRNPDLFRQAADYVRSGGRIDLTAGEQAGLTVPEAVRALAADGGALSRVTVSSDAGGSTPAGGAGKISALYSDFVEIIRQSVLPPHEAVRLFTENPAKVLKLNKGALREGGDADILVTDGGYHIKLLFAMGRLLLDRTA
ncbi:beta-aspartyl-dipeptidase (metallo-type) [Sporobacter termitidis DSM 10068]|uniref:Isoaspartyl dipeptidase n=1 Tax=Sporobacter termitidis DSM 10068 TaxID=1123282 RepID=A0A1M5YDT4_9FIRM|nr:beta-aspartyl-peptidase [Sporobacter termitidis]SHI10195.1 beta-aspartyl-dipeptidase (metallo-type) [Sporobacter termitidis DSM 10068]